MALVPVGIFGTLIERRFGPLPVVAIFVLAGAAGSALAVLVETPPLLENPPIYAVTGANGAALGLLCAWLIDDRRAARRGEDRENDLLGVYVIAVVLVLLSLTSEEANIAAAVGGALAGASAQASRCRCSRARATEPADPSRASRAALVSGRCSRTTSSTRPSERSRSPAASRARSGSWPPLRRSSSASSARPCNEGGWFGEAHASQVRQAAAEPDESARAARIDALIAEETRMGMLIGVAVGWELARELGMPNEPDQPGGA